LSQTGESKISNRIEILLVEDSESDAALTLESLAECNLTKNVHCVRDGVEALNFLRRETPYENSARPDLILLDLNMPRLDGREVLREVKNDEELKEIPIVVLTTSNHDKDILESYGLAANNYIVKPVDLPKFQQVIRQIQESGAEQSHCPQRLNPSGS